MSLPQPLADLEQQEWTDRVDDALSAVAETLLDSAGPASQELADCLHGKWLGHPLHPAITDLPVGAWTTAAVLDVLDAADGDGKYAAGADAAVALGLVGAAGAAITGLADWRHTSGSARKTGVLHASFNGAATTAYVLSLLLRKQGRRGAGRSLGFLGLSLATVGAYLGGHLSYGLRIGPDRSREELPSDEWTAVLGEEELPEGEMRCVETESVPVLLVRQRGQVHALADRCAHLSGPLHEGELKDGCVVCPWHGSTFRLEDGENVTGPSTFPQPVFETRVRDGQIEIRAREEEPH